MRSRLEGRQQRDEREDNTMVAEKTMKMVRHDLIAPAHSVVDMGIVPHVQVEYWHGVPFADADRLVDC